MDNTIAGADPGSGGGGAGTGVRIASPPPFWWTRKLHKEGKTWMQHDLVINSYLDPTFQNPVCTLAPHLDHSTSITGIISALGNYFRPTPAGHSAE